MKTWFQLIVIACLIGSNYSTQAASEKTAPTNTHIDFKEFVYQGQDAIFETPINNDEFRNPILAGFYPDPSITRAGDNYYLINSSFSYFPGVPIFQSQDLVSWKPLGHVLVTPKQLPLIDQQISRGIFAPTLRYHNGVFYMITTLVYLRGNFLVTATDPAGPWSDPIELPEIGGIDPDIFFDDDGKAYIAHNEAPIGEPLYNGHRAIWLWEFDLKTHKVVKDSGRVIVNGGADITQQPIWVEGPHIYKINGWYYLLCAEGGTGPDHSEVVFRSRSLSEPFVPYEHNPILTQRDLPADRPNPIAATGHADLIQAKDGSWWSVFLGTRPYDKNFFSTGRETFLLPVTWKDEWPIILPKGETVPYHVKAPAEAKSISQTMTGNFEWRDDFKKPMLGVEWNTLGITNNNAWLDVDNGLKITPNKNHLSSLAQAAFVGRRQQHTHYTAKTRLEPPQQQGVSAGIVAFQSDAHHYYLGVKKTKDTYQLFIEQTNKTTQIIASQEITIEKDLWLGIEGNAGNISFYVENNKGKHYLLKAGDGTLITTETAGGFVGTYLGMHARYE